MCILSIIIEEYYVNKSFSFSIFWPVYIIVSQSVFANLTTRLVNRLPDRRARDTKADSLQNVINRIFSFCPWNLFKKIVLLPKTRFPIRFDTQRLSKNVHTVPPSLFSTYDSGFLQQLLSFTWFSDFDVSSLMIHVKHDVPDGRRYHIRMNA